MNRDEINHAEWANLENWGVLGLYFSKRDSRVWVPKRKLGWGWTINLANPRSLPWLMALVVGPTLLGALLRRLPRRRGWLG